MEKQIYVTRPSIPDIAEYMEEIRPAFERHLLTNMGPIYQKFQEMLTGYLGVENLSLFVNGHMALEMAIQALGLKQRGEELGGGEVITTPFTFVSTTHAIARNGLRPVFCDIRRSDYCMDPDGVERLITEKTVAIVPVHVYGNICDVERIERIAQRHGLKVIYDGAHAFGETYRGQGVASFGDATMFSFHATKVFNSVEGGAVSFRDARYAAPLDELKNFGIHSEAFVPEIGTNAKLDEFRAAMGVCNLRHIGDYIAARKLVYERYLERLDGIDGIVLNKTSADVTSNYAYFPVYFDRAVLGFSRDDVCAALREHGIFARKYFYPAVNEMESYRGLGGEVTPAAHDASMNVLTLPMYEGLKAEDVDRICDVIVGMR